MKILHVLLTRMAIPPVKYGGTERVLWALLQGQKESGHEVRFLVRENVSKADGFMVFDPSKTMAEQVEGWADVIHFHWPYEGELKTPFICTEHSNCDEEKEFPINMVYLSSRHAENNNAVCYVHNGLYWPDYGEPNLDKPGDYVHFLAKASWRVKNIQGAVEIAQKAGVPMRVLGGKRISIRRNPYFFLSSQLHFHGMVGGEEKNTLIRNSKGLLFPVLWHEPFGLAVIESLYLGCPVFATPYGTLPDIITQQETGFLSDSVRELAEAVKRADSYDRRACHEHAKKHFSHLAMAKNYQVCYEKVLANETLNPKPPRSKPGIKARQTMRP